MAAQASDFITVDMDGLIEHVENERDEAEGIFDQITELQAELSERISELRAIAVATRDLVDDIDGQVDDSLSDAERVVEEIEDWLEQVED
jgi:hypothetical protein